MYILRLHANTGLTRTGSSVATRLSQACRLCSSKSGDPSPPPPPPLEKVTPSETKKSPSRPSPKSYSISAQMMMQMQEVLNIKVGGERTADGESDMNLAQPSGKWKKIQEDLRKPPNVKRQRRPWWRNPEIYKTIEVCETSLLLSFCTFPSFATSDVVDASRLLNQEKRRPGEMKPSMVSAVKDVARSLGGDVHKTESELLRKLEDHDSNTRHLKSISETMFGDMKSERTSKRSDKMNRGSVPSEEAEEDGLTAHMIKISANKMWSVAGSESTEQATSARSTRIPQEPQERPKITNLFGAEPLNIFNRPSDNSEAPKLDFPKLETWDRLEAKSLELIGTHPPANGFEEMIQWTEQGKLWKFPIDNEQGIEEEEASVGFHEHIFLEKHITDFPRKGPIRYFMELVLIGLSKNPYLKVQEKIEHIDWFRQYFKTHEKLLKEIGAMA